MSLPIHDRFRGALLGFQFKPGQRTNDTSMALSLGASLLESGFDPKDQMDSFEKAILTVTNLGDGRQPRCKEIRRRYPSVFFNASRMGCSQPGATHSHVSSNLSSKLDFVGI